MWQTVLVLANFSPFIEISVVCLTGSGDFQVAEICVLLSWATWKSPLPVRAAHTPTLCVEFDALLALIFFPAIFPSYARTHRRFLSSHESMDQRCLCRP